MAVFLRRPILYIISKCFCLILVRLKTLPSIVSVISQSLYLVSLRGHIGLPISLFYWISSLGQVPARGSCDFHLLFHLLMSLYRVVDVAYSVLFIIMPTMHWASLHQCTHRRIWRSNPFCLVIKMALSAKESSLYL